MNNLNFRKLQAFCKTKANTQYRWALDLRNKNNMIKYLKVIFNMTDEQIMEAVNG